MGKSSLARNATNQPLPNCLSTPSPTSHPESSVSVFFFIKEEANTQILMYSSDHHQLVNVLSQLLLISQVIKLQIHIHHSYLSVFLGSPPLKAVVWCQKINHRN